MSYDLPCVLLDLEDDDGYDHIFIQQCHGNFKGKNNSMKHKYVFVIQVYMFS
jgi:hypothetical protein